jgi:hypothetical protein
MSYTYESILELIPEAESVGGDVYVLQEPGKKIHIGRLWAGAFNMTPEGLEYAQAYEAANMPPVPPENALQEEAAKRGRPRKTEE